MSRGQHADLPRMELVISQALRTGVIVSGAVLLVGLILLAVTRDTGYAPVAPHHLRDLLSYPEGRVVGGFPTDLRTIAQGVTAARPFAVLALGLLLLIATPVVRVLLSLLFFLSQRDWLYVGITLIVLTTLLVSFVTGVG